MKKQEKEAVRPLARVLARELTAQEITQVAAAGCGDPGEPGGIEGGTVGTGGNGYDCTTGGVASSDRDRLQ